MARTLPDVLKWTPEHTLRTTRYLRVVAIACIDLIGGLFVLDRLRVANRTATLACCNTSDSCPRRAGCCRDMETAQRGFLLTGQDAFLILTAAPKASCRLVQPTPQANRHDSSGGTGHSQRLY